MLKLRINVDLQLTKKSELTQTIYLTRQILTSFHMKNNIYSFTTTSLQGKPINFGDFKDKVILVVNTASKCGLTPQYTGLQELQTTYADQGLIVIGFPCNQFGGQEPGDATEISQNCLVNYGVSFAITQKSRSMEPIQTRFLYISKTPYQDYWVPKISNGTLVNSLSVGTVCPTSGLRLLQSQKTWSKK